MKTDLDHLPEGKQNTIMEIRRLILNEVESYVENKAGNRFGCVVWLVLFGSYARGTYVDAPANGYVSDFDILVAVDGRALAEDLRLWHSIEDKVERLTRAPLNLIVHTHEEVAQWLKEGHYFFCDIRKEGIYLYSRSGKSLPEPKHLTNAERLPIAQQHFDQWYESACEFIKGVELYLSTKNYKLAAFMLHQSTERFYACLLLVLSNYRPRTHNIKNLRHMALSITSPDTSLYDVFPGNDKFQRRCFELLKRAYIDARYSEHFKITKVELDWLFDQVQQLKNVTKDICVTKIAFLKNSSLV